MKRWYPFFQVTLLTWAVHRIARALIGFPRVSFSNFKLVEFVVDIGLWTVLFAIFSWFMMRPKRRGKGVSREEDHRK